jgi:hypothetical protein
VTVSAKYGQLAILFSPLRAEFDLPGCDLRNHEQPVLNLELLNSPVAEFGTVAHQPQPCSPWSFARPAYFAPALLHGHHPEFSTSLTPHSFNSSAAVATEQSEDRVVQMADLRLDQESLVAAKEQQALLKKCVASPTKEERLILQLRFEQDLSLETIAGLTGLRDAQRVHRRIRALLIKLRANESAACLKSIFDAHSKSVRRDTPPQSIGGAKSGNAGRRRVSVSSSDRPCSTRQS